MALSFSLATAAVPQLFTTEEQARVHFNAFKMQYNKTYTVEEEPTRLAHFMDNLKAADKRNAADTAEHGITKFMDLSAAEFAHMYLGYTPPAMRPAAIETVVAPLADNLKAKKDWTGVYTTPVKNQGHCGSCWAFSATEQIESDAMRQLGVSYTLSTQQIISCDHRDLGCNGGNTETAYSYVEGAGGLVTAKDYPDTSHSTGASGTCSSSKAADPVVNVHAYHTVKGSGISGTEASMASYVQQTGPLSICVDANSWQTYRSGIMTGCGTRIDHCVQAVGIDQDYSTPYWKVRNSWDTTWGESGFIRLAYGSNQCGLTNDATYVDTGLVAHEKLVAQQAAALAAQRP